MTNKRGETESYSFLIGLVITFLLLSTVGCVVYQLYAKTAETEENFKNLVDKIKELKDGEQGKIPFYIDEEHIIVGFRSDSTRVESRITSTGYCYGWYTAGFNGLQIERPKKCQGKGCICLCEYKGSITNPGEEDYMSGIYITREVCNGAEDKCITEGMEQYNFVGGGGCDIAFTPGIKHRASIELLSGQPGEAEERGVIPVNYKREGNTITLDDEQINREGTQKETQKEQTPSF